MKYESVRDKIRSQIQKAIAAMVEKDTVSYPDFLEVDREKMVNVIALEAGASAASVEEELNLFFSNGQLSMVLILGPELKKKIPELAKAYKEMKEAEGKPLTLEEANAILEASRGVENDK